MNFNPFLWLGIKEFQDNRVDDFETLYLQLTRPSGEKVPLHFQIDEWAARDKARNNPRWRVYAYVGKKLRNGGTTFSQALKPFLPSEEFLLLQSGEFNGDLATAIRLVCDTIENKKSMMGTVAIVLSSGISTLSSVLLTAVICGYFLWPVFLDLAPIKYWAKWSIPLIDFHLFAAAHWLLIVTALGALVPIYFYLAPNWVGRSRNAIDNIPPFSIYKGLQAVSLLSALAALLESGVSVRNAMLQVSEIVPKYLRWHVLRMVRRYDASGEDAIKSIRTGLFTQAMQDRIEDAARGQSFDQVLRQVGSRSTDLLHRVIRRQAMIFSGVLLVINLAALSYTALVFILATDEAQNKAISAQADGVDLK